MLGSLLDLNAVYTFVNRSTPQVYKFYTGTGTILSTTQGKEFHQGFLQLLSQ